MAWPRAQPAGTTTIQAAVGAINGSTGLTVTAAADFALAASPNSLTIVLGNQGSSTITTTISGGFNSAITLSASGVPNGTTVSFGPNPIGAPGSGTSAMTISVGGNTAVGIYPITVTGNGGSAEKNTTIVTLNVTTSAPHVSLSWNASPSQVMGYNLYRSMASGGPYTKVNTDLITDTTYTDMAVQHGFTYYYVATAVDSDQMESMYSNEATAPMP